MDFFFFFLFKTFSFVFRSQSPYLRKQRTVNPVLLGCLNIQFRKKATDPVTATKSTEYPIAPFTETVQHMVSVGLFSSAQTDAK